MPRWPTASRKAAGSCVTWMGRGHIATQVPDCHLHVDDVLSGPEVYALLRIPEDTTGDLSIRWPSGRQSRREQETVHAA